MIQGNQTPPPVKRILDGAKRFAVTGHGFLFSFYDCADTIFWPGCGLAANRPDLVRQARNILNRKLETKAGLVLDCCYDPVFGLGDTETALEALKEINRKLRMGGVQRVITGCLNCHKLLSRHLDNMDVAFILEVLPPDVFEKQDGESIYLHHPCPASQWSVIRKKAVADVHRIDPDFREASEPRCCGAGGNLDVLSPELANRFLTRINRESGGRTLVTYCMGCRNRFRDNGLQSKHLLEYITGIERNDRVPSPLLQWLNRFFLAMAMRMNTKKILLSILIILLLAGTIYLNQQLPFSTGLLLNLLDRHPVLAPLIFLGVYAIAPSLFLPSIPIALAAGFFWGPVWGVIFSITGATIGASLSFFLARYLFQETVKSKIPSERWEWLQNLVVRHGWKAVAFTRLIPVFPFNLLNYLFGLTPIPFRQYLWSTFVFMLPACIAFVAFGSSLGDLIVRGNVRSVVIGFVIAACALLASLVIRPFFRKVGDNKEGVPDENSHTKDRT
jgi:uncharacterized membrane protein YdjX (TVP38/TMEM64 family)